MLLRLTVLCHLTCAALALQFLYDETIWTKQTWPAYKLPFPAQKILQAAEHKTALSHVSDLGPFNPDSYPQTYAGRHGTYSDAILDEVLDLLSDMIQCKACEILINSTWQLGTNWVQQKESHMTNQQLTEHMQAMCEITVPRKFLKEYAIVQGEASVSQAALPPGYSSSVVQTFSMQERGQAKPTTYEHLAVQQACHRLLSNKTEPEREAPPLSTLLKHLKKGLQGYQDDRAALKQEDAQQGREADPLAATEDCPDKHEKCPFWASIGECEKNMRYMVGFTNDAGEAVPGHCQLSCATCTLHAPPGLSVQADKQLQSASQKQLANTAKAACAAVGACSPPKDPKATPAGVSSGPSAGSSAGPSADAAQNAGQKQAAPNTKVAAQSGLERAIRPRKAPRRPAGKRPQAEWGKHPLGSLIGHQCFYISQGWWSFEVCCLSHVNQFHADNNQVETVHSLGVFDFETLAEPSHTIRLDKQDLLPGMRAGTAVAVQTFSKGQDCQITRDEDNYHGKDQTTVMRSTELRMACSPDTEAHMIVREPAQCRYIVTLYLPALCQMTSQQTATSPDHTEL